MKMPQFVIMCDICYDRTNGKGGLITLDAQTAAIKAKEHFENHKNELVEKGKSNKIENLQMEEMHGTQPPRRTQLGRPPAKYSSEPTAQPEPSFDNPVDQLCYKLVKEGRDKRSIQCNICKGSLTVSYRRDNIDITNALHHAYRELGPLVFSCRQFPKCKFQCDSENGVKKHLKQEHELSGIKENFKVASGKPEKEVMDMLTRCYGK